MTRAAFDALRVGDLVCRRGVIRMVVSEWEDHPLGGCFWSRIVDGEGRQYHPLNEHNFYQWHRCDADGRRLETNG